MAETGQSAGSASLLGGRVCLDFANTAEYHASEHPIELLARYQDLVDWSRHAGVIDQSTAARLLREAKHRPAEAKAALERAIALRETIYRVFTAIAHAERPRQEDLAALSAFAGEAFVKSQLVEMEQGFSWAPAAHPDTLDQMLYPIARSAAELLTSTELSRVRQCADTLDGCGWLFVDTTRNRSRRWCDMRDCGNRAKVRRFLARQREREEGVTKTPAP